MGQTDLLNMIVLLPSFLSLQPLLSYVSVLEPYFTSDAHSVPSRVVEYVGVFLSNANGPGDSDDPWINHFSVLTLDFGDLCQAVLPM